LIQDVTHLARVVDYIHLDPVRAGIVTPERLLEFRASSLGHFIQNKAAPWLVSHEFVSEAGLGGSEQLWLDYLQRLVAIATNLGDDERMIRGALSAGWAIGTSGWRKALARDHAHIRLAPEWAADELNEFRLSRWQHELECGLADLGKKLGDAADTPKSMAWKIELARRLRTVAAAPYRWIAETLNMGAPSSVRAYVARLE
jgi:putative transposase